MRATINYRELQSMYRAARKQHGKLGGSRQMVRFLSESISGKKMAPSDFSIKDLAEALIFDHNGEPVGREWVHDLNPLRADGVSLAEAANAVDISAFSNITQQIVSAQVMEGYEQAAFVISGLVRTIPTRLDGEKIPGMGKLGASDIEKIQPGMPYPTAGVGEDWQQTPSTTKSGVIVPVTKEAVFFDQTNQVLDRARGVGEALGLDKEKRLCDLVIGQTRNYNWRGVAYGTYSTDGTSTAHVTGDTVLAGVINKLASNELVDWTDVDAAEQLFAAILDPSTGEPVIISAKQVVVMPAYTHAARRVFNATEIRYTATSAATQTIMSNPLSGYTWYESVHAYRRLIAASVSASDAKKYWFVGDFAKAFAYMENWPITVVQADSNSEANFNRDIVAQFKASERGVAAVMNPRYVVMCTG
jgi:hypothetical protein